MTPGDARPPGHGRAGWGHRLWIALVALLVPREFRDDWRDEWIGELSARGALPGVARGALADAWYLRSEGWTVDGLVKDARVAVRGLLRKPLFTAVAGATLALGIGANTAIYSVVDGVLLDPLPFPDSHRIVSYNLQAPGMGVDLVPHSDVTLVYAEEHARALASFAVVDVEDATFMLDEEPRQLSLARISHGFFDVMGVHPFLGRGFTPGEDRRGAAPIAVLGEGLWRRSFGADPGILGRRVEIDGVAREVVGVVADGLAVLDDDVAVYVPLPVDDVDPSIGSFSYVGLGRLAEGSDAAAAQRELDELLVRLWALHPDEIPPEIVAQAQFGANVQPAKDLFVQDVRQTLWVVLGMVGMVLLIACANVANLFLVRAEGRQREQALRRALGAGRGALARQYLVESLILSVAAGAAGVALAWVGVQGLLRLAPVDLPGALAIDVDGSVLAFAAVVSLGTGVLFGLLPLLGQGRSDLAGHLKDGSRSATVGARRHRVRGALVVGQVALAMVLLVGSGLMYRSFQALSSVDPGFRSEGRLTFKVTLPEPSYPGTAETVAFHRALTDELAALPGARSAATISGLPLTDAKQAGNFEGEDADIPEGDFGPIVERRIASPGYFQAMGIGLVAGRPFQWDDGTDAGARVAIVSERLARTYWPGQEALGRRVRSSEAEEWMTVVGVVRDVHFEEIDAAPTEMVYMPPAWDYGMSRSVDVVVHTAGDPSDAVAAARDALRRVDARLPMVDPRPMDEIVRGATASASFTMLLLAIAAGIALLLGSVGIYGVISYVVAGRTQEIGVRMALGAPAATVLRGVIGQGLTLTGLGLVLGVLGAIALGRVMESLLYGVSALDPVTFAATSTVLAAVATLAAWIPARRAARVDPVEALRGE